jgi:hypothetical protein
LRIIIGIARQVLAFSVFQRIVPMTTVSFDACTLHRCQQPSFLHTMLAYNINATDTHVHQISVAPIVPFAYIFPLTNIDQTFAFLYT